MGKRLIIRNADFSANAILPSLDDLAYDGKTFRQIFEVNNALNISAGFESGNYSTMIIGAGTPEITDAVHDSGRYSLKAFGTTSQQIKTPGGFTSQFLLASRIKCDRYVSGYAGITYGNERIGVTSVTDGFVTLAFLSTSQNGSGFFVGSWSSANLDCYIDTPVAVDISVFTTVPSGSEWTALYNQYISIKKRA